MIRNQMESNFIFKAGILTFCGGIISYKFNFLHLRSHLPVPSCPKFTHTCCSGLPSFRPAEVEVHDYPQLQHCRGSLRTRLVGSSDYSINSFRTGTIFHSSGSQREGTKI